MANSFLRSTIITTNSDVPAQSVSGSALEEVARFDGPMPTGVSVSREGRVFVNFPKWGDQADFTVAELHQGTPVAYPNLTINRPTSNADAEALVSVQSIVVDPRDRLWLLDTGSPLFEPTKEGGPKEGGPKLVGVDLTTDTVFKTIIFPPDVALPTTYLNDIRFDLRRGDDGMAFITDSSDQGPNAIIVVDLATGASWRRLHDHPSTRAEPGFMPFVEGQTLMVRPEQGPPQNLAMGADGIAIGADGARLYYCPLASRRLYSVDIDALCDRAMSDDKVAATVVDEGDRGGGADGLETDAAGNIYCTNYEHHAITRRGPNGQFETVAHDPRLRWPDTMSVGHDGYLYVTANGFHEQARFHQGRDERHKPYYLYRLRIDAQPVLLR